VTWEWVAICAIVVLAWTVHKVTSMWQTVTFYRYSPDAIKTDMWDEEQDKRKEK